MHLNIRLQDDRLCTLVVIGVSQGLDEVHAGGRGRLPGKQGELAVRPSRADEARDEAPMLAIGDGALGFWAAARELRPETTQQLCWVHKLKNVLNRLPRRLQGRAKVALHEIMNAEIREQAEEACETFREGYEAKYRRQSPHSSETESDCSPSSTSRPSTRNTSAPPIQSSPHSRPPIAPRVSKGAGSRAKASGWPTSPWTWRATMGRVKNAPELVARVLLGEKFVDGLPETTDVGNAD